MHLTDSVTLSGTRRTRDGYLVADAKVARTGIQLYNGAELGRPDLGVVRVYRPESAVFARDAMASAAFKPVTNDHPSVMVDASNWREHSRGSTGSEVVRDGDSLRVPLVLMDAQAILDVEGGKRELSLGYDAEVTFKDGVTPQGEAYDAELSNIRVNHLAICSSARAGRDFRIGDRQPERDPSGEPAVALRTIMLDGLPVEITDAGAAAVDKLKLMLDASAKALTDAQTAHTQAIAAKDAELGKLTGELNDAKAKVLDAAALDKMVAERGAVIAQAKAMGLADTAITGKTNAEIKAAAVAHKLGDAAVKDRSEDYVGALFDHAAGSGQTGADPLRQTLADTQPVLDAKAKADAAWAAGVERAAKAWETPASDRMQ